MLQGEQRAVATNVVAMIERMRPRPAVNADGSTNPNPNPTPTSTPTSTPTPTPTPNQGKSLPLHYAVYRSGPEEVIRLLLDAYPDGVKAVNEVEALRS